VQDDNAIKELHDLLFSVKKKISSEQIEQLIALLEKIKELNQHEEELTRSEIMQVFGVILK
jgi:hypothetical protein